VPASFSKLPRPALLLLPALALAAVAVAAERGPVPAGTRAAACPEGMRPLGGGAFTLADGSARVEVKAFCLDATEVTAGAWAACVEAGACSADGLACSRAASWGAADKRDHPINCVTWFDADGYCRWRERRLPTEGEWEWAARGQARGRRFPWGEDPPGPRSCWDGEGNAQGMGTRSGTCPVASHPGGDSPEGLHDLAGNVREWTSSSDGKDRIIRGGSWGDSLDWFLAAGFRGFNHPFERIELTGFRCAAEPGARPAGIPSGR
jgi:sulfatase modifying factor 1